MVGSKDGRTQRYLGFAAAAMLYLGAAHSAPVAYVSDEQQITVRSGKGTNYRILRSIESGTSVRVLTPDSGDGYTEVRLADAATGWVRSVYLQAAPIARHRLLRAERRLQRTIAENARLLEDTATLRRAVAEKTKRRARAREELQQMTTELQHLRTLTASPERLEAEHKTLLERLVTKEGETSLLSVEHRALKDQARQGWLLAGSTVLIAGVLIGYSLSRFSNRRKSPGWR